MDKTRESYNQKYTAFVNFLQTLEEVPADWELCLVLFRGHLISKGLASRTVASYMTGVRSRLSLNGVELKENAYLMKQMHKAAQKQDVERLRCPVTKVLLEQVLKRIDFVTKTNYEAALFGAIFTLAYHGMFRIGELVESVHALKVGNVLQAVTGNLIQCIQHSSKTSKPGEGHRRVPIDPTFDEFCPCEMTVRYSQERKRALPYWRLKPGHFLVHQDGSKATKAQVLQKLRQCVKLIPGFVPMEFGMHSFRSGKAMDLFLQGMTDAEIMERGRWTSAAFRWYIKP